MQQAGLDYDVFLSFCSNCCTQTTALKDHDVFPWIKNHVLVLLEHSGYTVYCPWFHIAFGHNREEEVTCAIQRSGHYVVCLCDCYLSDTNSVTEFDLIWKKFRRDESKRITVINFAHLRKRSITDRRLNAFRRLRDDLNFKTTGSRITERLKRRIGPPMVKRFNCDRANERNAKLTHHDSAKQDEPNCNRRFTTSKIGDRTYFGQFRWRQQRQIVARDHARASHNVPSEVDRLPNYRNIKLNLTVTDLEMGQPPGFYEASV